MVSEGIKSSCFGFRRRKVSIAHHEDKITKVSSFDSGALRPRTETDSSYWSSSHTSRSSDYIDESTSRERFSTSLEPNDIVEGETGDSKKDEFLRTSNYVSCNPSGWNDPDLIRPCSPGLEGHFSPAKSLDDSEWLPLLQEWQNRESLKPVVVLEAELAALFHIAVQGGGVVVTKPPEPHPLRPTSSGVLGSLERNSEQRTPEVQRTATDPLLFSSSPVPSSSHAPRPSNPKLKQTLGQYFKEQKEAKKLARQESLSPSSKSFRLARGSSFRLSLPGFSQSWAAQKPRASLTDISTGADHHNSGTISRNRDRDDEGVSVHSHRNSIIQNWLRDGTVVGRLGHVSQSE